MTTLTKTFHSFEAELELYEENGEPRSSCFITKGNAVSSLAAVEAFGTIDAGRGEEIPVPDSIYKRVEAWAYENGY